MTAKFKKRVLLSPPQTSGFEMQYIEKAFEDNWIAPLGPQVTEFEARVVKYLDYPELQAVAMSSGTAALHIALKLLNLKPGEEVFCSSATFIATANPILYEKAIPVFIDSENDTWNLCPDSLLKAILAKKAQGRIPRILICVDLFGMSANYLRIVEICTQYGIEIIDDSAEALGSSLNDRKCGTFGRFGILSFNGNKIITTSGGGMLVCHNKEEAAKALFLITQARDKAPYYLHSEVGYNYRMSNICAGIGLGQLQVLQERVSLRRQHFYDYQKFFENKNLHFIKEPSGFFSNHWLSAALINPASNKTPSELIEYLDSLNVEARHIWKPLHTQPIFKGCEFYHIQDKPVAESVFEAGICLPSGSYMNHETQLQICHIIDGFLS